VALNISIQTYTGHVNFGIIAGKQALPDARELATAIEQSLSRPRL